MYPSAYATARTAPTARSIRVASPSLSGVIGSLTSGLAIRPARHSQCLIGAGLGSEVSLADFRKNLTIEVYNEAGQLAIAYNVFRCWVSEFQSLPDLDANANAIAIQHIKLENEGWERDLAVVEPAEPTFTEPA